MSVPSHDNLSGNRSIALESESGPSLAWTDCGFLRFYDTESDKRVDSATEVGLCLERNQAGGSRNPQVEIDATFEVCFEPHKVSEHARSCPGLISTGELSSANRGLHTADAYLEQDVSHSQSS